MYTRRISDEELSMRLESRGAVLVQGPKWCGKTTTALQQSASVVYMQDPTTRNQNIQLASMNPSILLAGKTPRLIDEWQIAPQLWDAVRFEVDKRNDFGQFILTGSATPADLPETSHTGIGRISKMQMRTMSLQETGDSDGAISLESLFNGVSCAGSSDVNLEEAAYFTCRGGWPRALGASHRVALRQAIDYYDAVASDDVSQVDNVSRDPIITQALLRSLARAESTQANFGVILADVQASGVSVSEKTLRSYDNALKKLFVTEDMPTWSPNLRSKTAIRTTPTRHMSDPSIAAAALGAGPGALIGDLETFGLLFEGLCVHDLRVYAQALDGQVSHYRDSNGLECDAVVHLRDGRYGLVEVKLGGDDAIEYGAKTLQKLESRIDTTRMGTPSFKMVLTATSPYSFMREDGIYVANIANLGK
jgi:predicted AAA+ superfamily ATPase